MNVEAILDRLQAEVIAGESSRQRLQEVADGLGRTPRELLLELSERAPRRRRWVAAAAMGHLEDPELEGPLVELIRDYDNPFHCRAAAFESLHRLAPGRTLELAVQVLRDRENGLEIRDFAGELLERYPAEELAEALGAALDDASSATRRIAARTLGKAGAHGLLDRIAELAENDPEGRVREAARAAAQRLSQLASAA